MAPANELVKYQVVDKVRELVAAIDPAVNSDYWAEFDFVDVTDPPPEGFLRESYEVPDDVNRLCIVWHDDDPREERDTGRNQGTLAVIVTAAERYGFDDRNPFADKEPGFLSRTLVRARLESDLLLALNDLHLAGKSVNFRLVDSRVPLIATRYEDYPWVEIELMYDALYKYKRALPWAS